MLMHGMYHSNQWAALLKGRQPVVHLYEACSERRVDGIKDQPVALEGFPFDRALPLHGVHANGGAVHEDVPSHLPADASFQGCSPGATAQRRCKLLSLLSCSARPNFPLRPRTLQDIGIQEERLKQQWEPRSDNFSTGRCQWSHEMKARGHLFAMMMCAPL